MFRALGDAPTRSNFISPDQAASPFDPISRNFCDEVLKDRRQKFLDMGSKGLAA